MIGKTDWTEYLHAIRKGEINMVFSLLPKARFATGLEIGAGDGFQTTLLSPYIDKLISSDLNFKRIKESLKVQGVEYKTIDADRIEGVFPYSSFDLIFSSNVLEHLSDPSSFLVKTLPMLTNNGYAVHIIPSRHIKIFYLALYYPHLALLVLDRLIGRLKGEAFFKGAKVNLENNINIKPEQKASSGRLKKFLFPPPHGNFPTHAQEFIAFGKGEWERLFKQSGYQIIIYAKGPVFSGYGFGFTSVRRLLEYCGVSSEHIFVLKKISAFESEARAYTNNFLPRGSAYEKEKFVQDWIRKESNARAFIYDFKKDVGDPRGKKVLDVGFGNGIMLSEFARAGAVAYGLETESALLDLAGERLKDSNTGAILKIYDGKSFPFADNTFDYTYSTSVLEHMSYPGEVLSEIGRTLIPGGRFYLSFPNKYAPKESHTGLWFISWLPRSLSQYILQWSGSSPLKDWNLHFISFFTLKKMAQRAGLRIVYNTSSKSPFKAYLKKILVYCGVHYGVFLKTIILVLEKPVRVNKSKIMRMDNLLNLVAINVKNKSAVLELGCGEGELVNAIVDKFSGLNKIVAVDCIDRSGILHKEVEFVKQDIENLNISGSFDLVILNQVLEHIKNPLGLLEKLKKNLNLHGRILIVVPNCRGFNNEARVYWPEHGKHYFLWDRESLEYSLNRIGFTCRFYNLYIAASHNVFLKYLPMLFRLQNPNLACVAMVD